MVLKVRRCLNFLHLFIRVSVRFPAPRIITSTHYLELATPVYPHSDGRISNSASRRRVSTHTVLRGSGSPHYVLMGQCEVGTFQSLTEVNLTDFNRLGINSDISSRQSRLDNHTVPWGCAIQDSVRIRLSACRPVCLSACPTVCLSVFPYVCFGCPEGGIW